MSTQTVAQQNADRHYWRSRRLIQILNSIGLEYQVADNLTPLQLNECFHQGIHEYVNETPLPIEIPNEVLYIPQLVAHALNHAKQTNIYYREDCGFWEDLPEPTIAEAVKDVFGLRAVTPARSSAERQVDNFLYHRSFHERLAAEARAEEEAQEAAQQNDFQLQAESLQPEPKLYPIFTGLKLKNSDRAEKDGYLLYVGSRSDCVRAASTCQKGSVKANSKDGSSWKYLVKLTDIIADSQQSFNFKLFASSAIQSYKSKNAA